MFKQIVVTLDGSGLAEVALPYAEELVGRLHSRLVLLHVRESGDEKGHRRYLANLVRSVKQNVATCHGADTIQAKAVIVDGNPAEEIINYVEAHDIDLTIMATHGRSGLSRWAMGSVADKVLRGMSRPVALIRARGSHADVCLDGILGKILAPLDGSEASEAALPYIEELARKLGAKVVLLQVVPRDAYSEEIRWIEIKEFEQCIAKTYLQHVQNDLQKQGVQVGFDIRVGHPAREIIDLAMEAGASIIGMSTHGRSGVDRWVFGSVAEKVLRAGNTPVLLVRAPGSGFEW